MRLTVFALLAASVLFSGTVLAQGTNLNGANNTAPGSYAGVGGSASDSTGVGGFVWGIGSRQLGGGSAFGRNLRADGTDTHVTGQGVWALRDNGGGNGWANLSQAMQGWVTGHQSNDRGIQGARAYAIGSFVNTGDAGLGVGDAQRIELILRTITTTNTPEQLSSSAYNDPAGIAPNVNVLTVPDYGTLRVRGGAVARDPVTGSSKSWDIKALIVRGSGAGSVRLVGSSATPEFADADTSAWNFVLSADAGKGSLGLTAVGEANREIQWVAHIISVENVGSASAPPPPPPPPGLSVTTSSLPVGTVGTPYSTSLSASGGTAPYRWSATGLPSGLGVSGSSIAGTPTAAFAGTVTLTVTDFVGATASRALTLAINAPTATRWDIVYPDLKQYVDAGGTTWQARDWTNSRMALERNGLYEGIAPIEAYYPGYGTTVYCRGTTGAWKVKWTGTAWVYMAAGEIPPGY